VVAASRCEEVRGSRVELDLTDLARARVQLGGRLEVLGRPAVLAPAIEQAVLDVPDEDCV
jgi:hypothetical protein